MWTFVIGLFMHQLGGMTWVAVQQLVDSSLKLTFITIAGHFMDRIDRDKIIQRSLAVNNAAVAVSALIFAYMFAFQPESYATAFLLLASAIASISKVASEIQRICFTKDWVVVISKAENIELSRLNSVVSCIDQVSLAVLPTITGILLNLIEWQYICVMIAVYNFASWILESWILRRLYQETEQLKTKGSELTGEPDLLLVKDVKCHSINVYFEQTSWTAGFGLSLLYMTVLGFDNLAASYGQKHGMSAGYIGALRGAGAVLGIFGSICFPYIASRVGLLWTVMIGLLWQNLSIDMCGVSVLLPGSSMDVTGFIANTTAPEWIDKAFTKLAHPEPQDAPPIPFRDVAFSVNLFFVGIMLARFGLWLADPAITQIQQETVPEKKRYMVFSVQTGFNELFSILKDIIVIMLPFTSLFGLLTLGSCVFVFTGFMFNVFYHAQCGFSLTNKFKHLPQGQQGNEMVTLSQVAPERQSLIGEDEEAKKSGQKNGNTIVG